MAVVDVTGEIGSACSVDVDCYPAVNFSHCSQDDRCTCDDGHVSSMDNTTCIRSKCYASTVQLLFMYFAPSFVFI